LFGFSACYSVPFGSNLFLLFQTPEKGAGYGT
jgi:hypothetical protein